MGTISLTVAILQGNITRSVNATFTTVSGTAIGVLVGMGMGRWGRGGGGVYWCWAWMWVGMGVGEDRRLGGLVGKWAGGC